MYQGQIREIPSLDPGKLCIFITLALIFHRSLLKLGTPTLFKVTFSKSHEEGYLSKTFRNDHLKIVVPISICKKAAFNYDFCIKS